MVPNSIDCRPEKNTLKWGLIPIVSGVFCWCRNKSFLNGNLASREDWEILGHTHFVALLHDCCVKSLEVCHKCSLHEDLCHDNLDNGDQYAPSSLVCIVAENNRSIHEFTCLE